MKEANQRHTGYGRKKTLIKFFGLVVFASLCLVLLAAHHLYRYARTPLDPEGKAVIFTMDKGHGLNAASIELVREHLISSSAKFKILAAVTGRDKGIKAGEYRLSPAMSPWSILTVLVNGRVYLHKLTIPEGYNIYQVADAVEKAGLGTREDFITVATDPLRVRKMTIPEPAQTFEGYLFPDTYYFAGNAGSVTIIRTMVERLRRVYSKKWFSRGDELGFSQHEVLTLASIIEKETGDAQERPMISSVFHNRLKKNMRLETDPTVIYGIKDFDGNLTRKHLNTVTPYNTYRNKGLPPGPIANPGLKSIEAALYPADTNYLYFVSKKDNTHQFSTNIRDHINSVRKYQLRR